MVLLFSPARDFPLLLPMGSWAVAFNPHDVTGEAANLNTTKTQIARIAQSKPSPLLQFVLVAEISLSCDRSGNRDERLTPGSLGGPAGGSGPRVGGVGWSSQAPLPCKARLCLELASGRGIGVLHPEGRPLQIEKVGQKHPILSSDFLQQIGLLTTQSLT